MDIAVTIDTTATRRARCYHRDNDLKMEEEQVDGMAAVSGAPAGAHAHPITKPGGLRHRLISMIPPGSESNHWLESIDTAPLPIP
jgi:hypothetical protein